MRRFTELYLALDSTTKSSEKVDLLAAYFASVEPADGAWALAVLTGGRPRGTPSSRALKELASEVTGFPAWLVDECHAAAGDLSEALALMLGRRGGSTDEPLHETMERRVAPLAGADERERKRIIRGAWEAFDARERFVYHKLLRGGMRVGVQRRTVSRALARVADVAPEVMLHRLAGGVEPTPEAFERVLSGDGGVGREGPYPFFLAHQLNEDPGSALGDRSAWRVEPKWDGIRAQLSVRDGRAALWSRGDEIVTHQFPEIEGAAAALPDGTVLDGEIVAWRDGAALPFAALQTRLNRKAPPTHQLGLFEQETVAFLAFDVLEHEGMDQRARTQRERVEILRRVMEGVPGESPIKLCRPVDAATWADVGAWRAGARERGVEGQSLFANACLILSSS